MLTIQQKAQSVLWYHKLKSPTAVQFRNEFRQDPPHTNSIKRWFKNFMETSSILDRKRSGRPSIDEETVDAVRVAFHRSPRKSIRVASNELAIPRSPVHKVLHKRLRLHAYKLQIVQALKPDDHPRQAAFTLHIQNAAGFHKIFKPSLNAVSVRRVLSKLISKITLYCSW